MNTLFESRESGVGIQKAGVIRELKEPRGYALKRKFSDFRYSLALPIANAIAAVIDYFEKAANSTRNRTAYNKLVYESIFEFLPELKSAPVGLNESYLRVIDSLNSQNCLSAFTILEIEKYEEYSHELSNHWTNVSIATRVQSFRKLKMEVTNFSSSSKVGLFIDNENRTANIEYIYKDEKKQANNHYRLKACLQSMGIYLPNF